MGFLFHVMMVGGMTLEVPFLSIACSSSIMTTWIIVQEVWVGNMLLVGPWPIQEGTNLTQDEVIWFKEVGFTICEQYTNVLFKIFFDGENFVHVHQLLNLDSCLKSYYNKTLIVATLALGLRPRQGVTRLWVKRKTRESHHMLPGVPKSVREWTLTLPSELPCWELESKWTPESSECDYRGQNPSPQRVLYIIEKLLKLRCLKWACITHLDIWDTSYG